MKKQKIWFTCAILTVILGSCTGFGVKPTATLTPSATSAPTTTNTPQPTATLTPTRMPALKIDFELPMDVYERGFSWRLPSDYEGSFLDPIYMLSNQDKSIFITFTGETLTPQELEPIDILDAYLFNSFGSDNEYDIFSTYPIKIDNVEGLAVDLAGNIKEIPFKGQGVIAAPSNSQYFFAFAIARTNEDETLWDREGAQVFNAFLNNVKFITADATVGECGVSTDPTYGYTKDNPIKVGGGDFGGPSRERAYLDNLQGPNGEVIEYERKGSFQYSDTILDEYTLTGLKDPVILYIDEYEYETVQAPVGFVCAGAFPLSKP